MTRFEMIAGCRTRVAEDRAAVQRFEILKFNEPTTDLATRLLTRYSLSHGLKVADACIAASALNSNASLATGNTDDFQFIRGLRLISYL
jgi:predicted nucleic acid-binding protein